MKIISYDGYTFASNGYIAGVEWLWGQWQVIHNEETRLDAPALLTGGTVSTRAIPVQFSYSGGSTWETAALALMARLDPMNTEARTLVAQLNDGTNVSCEAVVQVVGTSTSDQDALWLEVVFITADPYWSETTDSTEAETGLDAADFTRTVTNNGAVAAAPTITLDNYTGYVTALRDRRQVTVTNAADLPLEREVITTFVPYSVGMDGGAALLKDGTFHPVTRHYPSGAAYQWFAFPVTVDTGESEVYDLIGQINTEGDLDTFTRFDGNYCAQDLTFESWSVTSATTTVITVSGANWVTNRWAGAVLQVYAGTGAALFKRIASNTATTITVSRAFNAALDNTSKITLIGSGYFGDSGVVSGSSTTTITDASQSWVPNSLVGLNLAGSTSIITANTATQITFSPALGAARGVGTEYNLYGMNYHRYYVDQVKHSEDHRGGWQINKRFTQPSKVLWGEDILSAWAPFLLHENNDDFNQVRWTPISMGGSDVDYWPMLDADRRRGQDRRLEEEGQADGVAIFNPLGYQAIRFDYQIKNPNSASGATDGICKFVFAGREAGGDEFEIYVEDDQLQASLTAVSAQNVDLSAYGSPEQLYMGVLPADGVEVSRDAAESDTATVRWYQTLRLWLDVRNRLTVAYGSVESVIPVQDEIRIGNYALQIGMRDGQRLYIKPTDDIVLNCATATATLISGATQTDITYAVTPVVYDGTTTTIAERWPVLEPGSNTVTFTTSVWAVDGGYDATFVWKEKHYG